ncbi:MAG: hypothetical protein KAJ98_09430, partial [Spirochaetaceae bacterium]|nr:hypothetical protein [Spirochaetaceae bacterium]
MTIDDVNELGSDAVSGDLDGFDESLTLVASTWNWWVKFDSTNIPDGDINVHYVVVDKAGNKTHYTKSARIENNPPIIESVLLGTDVNYDTNVDITVGDGETFEFRDESGTDGSGVFYVDFTIPVSGITTRNSRLFLDADESLTDGNGDPATWLWELYYKGGGVNLLGIGVDSTTITNFTVPSMPDENGVSYILRVTDDAGLVDEVELLLNLDNTDDVDPVVIMNDLDLNYYVSIDARGGVDNYGYAIPGYTPSDTPLWINAKGRMRPDGIVAYDGDDADVSGRIIVSGFVDDDKAIHRLDLTITGYNGGLGAGNSFTILDWDSTANSNLGGLKIASGVIGTAFISSESYGESSGHVVFWSFELDTATITGGAAANVRVTAEATDKSSNSNTPDNDVTADNYTMDVMPFITEIQREDTGTNPVIRTRYGSWPFPEGIISPIWIYGFNLSPDTGTVKLVNNGDTTEEILFSDPTVHSSSKLEGILSVDDGGGTEIAITHSGRLTFNVNTIPLMNDYGDFDEDDGSHSYWTDERYVEIWKVGDTFTNSDYAVYAAMDTDISDGSFMASWSHWSSSSVYTSPQGGARTSRFYRYDPPEYTDIALNDDGTPYVAFLANFLGGGWTTADSGGVALWSTRASNAAAYGGNAAEEADAFYQDQMLWQFRNPRVAVVGDDALTDVYMTYFDQASNALKFSHFRDISANDSIYNMTLYPVAEGVNDSTNDATALTNNPNFIRDYNLYDYNIINDGNVSTYYGTWSDVAVDTRVNAPVLLFSDTGDSAVRLMRATSLSPVDHDVDNLMDFEFISPAYVEDVGGTDGNDDAIFDWH